MIEPDDLGALGEACFMGLCASASLICNRSERDRAGWDFIVEFNFDNALSATLDKRVAPLSCYVQVKTINSQKNIVKLKLNMAERLAKEIKPCFICIFKVDDNHKFTDCYLVHVYGDRLGKILRRLRVEEKEKTDREKLGKKFISFTPMSSERIEMSGSALRLILEKLSGNDIHNYADKKISQLKKLGFEKSAFTTKMTLHVSNQDDIADIFLGLKADVPAKHFDASETRFGIELIDPTVHATEITIKPHPLDGCTVSIRDRNNGAPVSFRANFFATPFLMNGYPVYLIKGDWISLRAKQVGKDVIMEVSVDGTGRLMKPSVWADYWRVMEAIRLDHALLEIRPDSTGEALIEMRIDAPDVSVINALPSYADSIVTCDRLSKIIKYAGIHDEPVFKLNDIAESGEDIWFVSALVAAEKCDLSFDMTNDNIIDGIPDHSIIYLNKLTVGDITLAYYAMVWVSYEYSGGKKILHLRDFEIKKLRKLSDHVDSFKAFEASAKKAEEMVCVLRGYLASN